MSQKLHLVVSCHPLPGSLCHHLAAHIVSRLQAEGRHVEHIDLYDSGFDPRLTVAERRSYYDGAYDDHLVQRHIALLQQAQILILVFPTWWFGFPAVLKGWFDRVWAPGFAYDHADDLGPIRPRLKNLRHVLAVTTLGAPWFVDVLLLRRPLRRVLKWALIGTCARQAKFRMLSLYKAENIAPSRLQHFISRIDAALLKMKL